MDEGQVVTRRLLIPRGYSPVMLQPVEQALDLVAVRIQVQIDLTVLLPVALARNHYLSL